MKKQPSYYHFTNPLQYSYHLYLFTLLLFSLGSCKKQYDPTKAQLPDATQEGKNTVGFTVDGAVWVPYAKCGAFRNPCEEILTRYGLTSGAAPNGIDFSFTRQRNGTLSSLFISSPFATITSLGEKIDSIGVTYLDENSVGNSGYFMGTQPGSSFVITKIDSSAQIISGQFEFIMGESNGSGKIITLKNGRFDFKFNTCKCSN